MRPTVELKPIKRRIPGRDSMEESGSIGESGVLSSAAVFSRSQETVRNVPQFQQQMRDTVSLHPISRV